MFHSSSPRNYPLLSSLQSLSEMSTSSSIMSTPSWNKKSVKTAVKGKHGLILVVGGVAGALALVAVIITVVIIYWPKNASSLSSAKATSALSAVNTNNGNKPITPFKQVKFEEKDNLRNETFGDSDQSVLQEYVDENLGFEGLGEESEMATIDQEAVGGGMMNTDKARDKKWDPSKMIPQVTKDVRPANSLAAKFGPSKTEHEMYLPSFKDLARSNVQGPKYVRQAKAIRSSSDFRRMMVPKDHDDYDTTHRGNRPRINQKFYEEALESEKRFYSDGRNSVNSNF